jgi:hypothetical protein
MTQYRNSTIAAALLCCSISSAHAQGYLPYLDRAPVYRVLMPEYVEWLRSKNYLPPPEFDHPYKGEMKIIRGTQQELRAACPTSFKPGNNALGCMKMHLEGMPCVVYILNDIGLQMTGWDYDIVFRHERAHCLGWKHD